MYPLLVGIMLSTLAAAPATACGFRTNGESVPDIPQLAVVLDDLLPDAKLVDSDLKTIKALRADIAELATANKIQQARAVEEQAMKFLGYGKGWLHCGPGSFTWVKLPQKTSELAPGDS